MNNSTIKPSKCKQCGSPFHSAMWHKPRKPIAVKTPRTRTVKPMPKVSFKFKPCKLCGSEKHYASFCPTLAKLPIPARKRMQARGKTFTRWSLCKSDWFDDHPAPFYTCHYCNKKLGSEETTLDHKIPRSRAPELRYEPTNLVPCCFTCNGLKGSIEHDKYPHNCNDRIKA